MRVRKADAPGAVVDDSLVLAVFALTHAACGDGTEVRIGERRILGWWS